MLRGMTKPVAREGASCAWRVAILLLCSLACHAQDFPSRPIRLIVPQAPGGGTDILGRNVAQKLGEQLRQPAIVENRTGADRKSTRLNSSHMVQSRMPSSA